MHLQDIPDRLWELQPLNGAIPDLAAKCLLNAESDVFPSLIRPNIHQSVPWLLRATALHPSFTSTTLNFVILRHFAETQKAFEIELP